MFAYLEDWIQRVHPQGKTVGQRKSGKKSNSNFLQPSKTRLLSGVLVFFLLAMNFFFYYIPV